MALTLEADVSEVQHGRQQLEDFLELVFREVQRLHGQADATEVFSIVSAFAHDAVALKDTRDFGCGQLVDVSVVRGASVSQNEGWLLFGIP